MMRLLMLILLCATTCQAQLPGNPSIARQFLSWDAAWNDSSSSAQKMLSWVPRARQGNWNASDAPFLAIKSKIDQAWKKANGSAKFADSYQQRALDEPTVLHNYAWGYAKWLLWHSGVVNWHQTVGAQQAMGRTYVPSTQYTRVLFLLSQSHWPTVREPIAALLIHKLPNDNGVKAEAAKVFQGIPTLAARQQAERLHKELLTAFPAKNYSGYLWSSMGHFYDQWKRWNTQIGQSAKSSADKAKAKQLAVRDAKLAISSWQKAVALQPNTRWSREQAPQLITSVNKWLEQNA